MVPIGYCGRPWALIARTPHLDWLLLTKRIGNVQRMRIEADIKAGDFAKAVQEYQTLPKNVQAAGSVFFTRVQTRLQAEDLVRKALASALKTG